MLPSEEELENVFLRNIDEIAEAAIASYGLKFANDNQSNLGSPLLRWIDFTMRYIPPSPRSILASSKFPMALPADALAGLERIEKLFLEGGNVNPYQGKTLTGFDTGDKKRQRRTDGLWAEWRIHHLHLPASPAVSGQLYSDRSDWLLFVMVYNNVAMFIDVREHAEDNVFSLNELVETYLQNWPEDAERFELKGIVGLAWDTPPTDLQRKELRVGGVTSFITVNGKVYAGPGGGVTTAATATRVTLALNNVRANTRLIAREVARIDGQFMKAVLAKGIDSPIFEVAYIPETGLGIIEKHSKIFWKMPRIDSDPKSLFPAWHNSLLPSWSDATVSAYFTSLSGV